MANENIDRLAVQFMDHARTLISPANGKPYRSETITQWAAALAGFIIAMKADGITDLAKLPETFLLTSWLRTQESVWPNTIRMRIRSSGITQFANWLRQHVPDMPPVRGVSITKDFNPIEMLKNPAYSIANPTPEEYAHRLPSTKPRTVNDFLDRAGVAHDDVAHDDEDEDVANADPTQEHEPMNARSAMEDPDSPVPMEQPRLVPPPIPRASEERVEAAPPVMLPTPRARAGAASKSGLAAMLPSSAHKLRVRLERDGKDALFIADFPESIVMSYGSVEQFLLAQPIRRVPAEDLRSDTLRFRVCIIEPTRGAEGQVNVYDVAVPPELRCVVQPQPQVQPALPQVQQAQQPFNPATLLDSVQEISDRDREKAEELIEKLSAKLRQPQTMQRPPWQPPQPRMPPLQASGSVAIDRIGDAVNKLTNIVLETNERMSRYEQGGREQARSAQLGQMQQPAQSAPLNDMLLPLLMKLLDRQLTPAPAPSESSHLETLKELMALARPQHIETDTSELEGYIEKLEKKIEDNNPMKMLGQLKEYKELFRPGGLLSNEGDRQSSGLLGGLRDLLGMVFDNTEKIEKIAAGVINSMAEAKVQAIRQTMSSMPQRQLAPAASPRVEAPVAPVVQQRPAMPLTTPVDPVTEPQRAEGAPAGEVMPTTPPKELPKEINDKIVELLTSTSPTLMVVLVYDLMELMGKFQPTEIVVEKVMGYLQDNKLPNLVIYLRDVFKILGYGEVATATRIQAIVDAIKAQIEAARAADAPAAAPATTPTAGTGPIEVGDEDIEESEPSDSGIDGEDEQEGDDDDDSSDGEDDDSDGEDEPDVKGKGAPIVIHTAGKQEPEVADG